MAVPTKLARATCLIDDTCPKSSPPTSLSNLSIVSEARAIIYFLPGKKYHKYLNHINLACRPCSELSAAISDASRLDSLPSYSRLAYPWACNPTASSTVQCKEVRSRPMRKASSSG